MFAKVLLVGLLGLFLVGVGLCVRYHRRMQVRQPLPAFLVRYFLGDYLLYPVRWAPGFLGLALRYAYYKVVLKRMGSSVTILEGAQLINPSHIEIGSHSGIGCECYLEATGPIRIGDWVRIGPRVSMFTTNHKFERRDTLIKKQGYAVGRIDIGDDVWFGANVTVLPNVRIGTGAVVGAGAVVAGDIPEYAIAAGNPAKVIRYRE